MTKATVAAGVTALALGLSVLPGCSFVETYVPQANRYSMNEGDQRALVVQSWRKFNRTGVMLKAGQAYRLEPGAHGPFAHDALLPADYWGWSEKNPVMSKVMFVTRGGRRAWEGDWFELIGEVLDDQGEPLNGSEMCLGRHMRAPDGKAQAVSFVAPSDGQLVLYANDWTWARANNDGGFLVNLVRLDATEAEGVKTNTACTLARTW